MNARYVRYAFNVMIICTALFVYANHEMLPPFTIGITSVEAAGMMQPYYAIGLFNVKPAIDQIQQYHTVGVNTINLLGLNYFNKSIWDYISRNLNDDNITYCEPVFINNPDGARRAVAALYAKEKNVVLLIDEPELKHVSLGQIAGFVEMLKRQANLPIWINFSPKATASDIRNIGKYADIVGMDIYPIPGRLKVHSAICGGGLPEIGCQLDRVMSSTNGKKPIWAILQGFGWSDLGRGGNYRRPRASELRCMAISALIHGASGVFFWGTQYIGDNSALHRNIIATLSLVREVTKQLSGRKHVLTARLDSGIEYGLFENKKSVLMLVANRENKISDFSCDLEGYRLARAGRDIVSGGPIVFDGRVFSSHIQPSDVDVYLFYKAHD